MSITAIESVSATSVVPQGGAQPTWIFAPTNAVEAFRIADTLSKSTMIPEAFRGKPGDIIIALQMGSEVGLAPMQALQGIAVINGRPSIWGDTLDALVRAHPSVLSITETLDGEGDARVATCVLRRQMRGVVEETKRTFSWADALTAKLTTKAGPWIQYPNRMLQMRARGFCLRDGASDILKGLAVIEEVLDFGPAPVTVTHEVGASKRETLGNALAARVDQLGTVTHAGEKPQLPGVPDFKGMKLTQIAQLLTDFATERGMGGETFVEITREFGGKLNHNNAAGIYARIASETAPPEFPQPLDWKALSAENIGAFFVGLCDTYNVGHEDLAVILRDFGGNVAPVDAPAIYERLKGLVEERAAAASAA